jgi:hypothetical protein
VSLDLPGRLQVCGDQCLHRRHCVMLSCLDASLDGILVLRRLSPQHPRIVTRHLPPHGHQTVQGIRVLRIKRQDYQESILGLYQMTALQ